MLQATSSIPFTPIAYCQRSSDLPEGGCIWIKTQTAWSTALNKYTYKNEPSEIDFDRFIVIGLRERTQLMEYLLIVTKVEKVSDDRLQIHISEFHTGPLQTKIESSAFAFDGNGRPQIDYVTLYIAINCNTRFESVEIKRAAEKVEIATFNNELTDLSLHYENAAYKKFLSKEKLAKKKLPAQVYEVIANPQKYRSSLDTEATKLVNDFNAAHNEEKVHHKDFTLKSREIKLERIGVRLETKPERPLSPNRVRMLNALKSTLEMSDEE